jgi:hypothetical protein
VHTRRALDGGACRSDRKGCCTTRTPHMRCRAPCRNPILRLSTAQVMFVSRDPLRVIRTPLSASDGSCSRHPSDGDARAHHKECCTPRLPRVHVKSIARNNGPTNACQPQTRGRRVRTPSTTHRAAAILGDSVAVDPQPHRAQDRP